MILSARKGCTKIPLISGNEEIGTVKNHRTNEDRLRWITEIHLSCLTWGEEGQCADGFIRHDVVEASQLSKHLEVVLLLSSGIGGQAFPLPSIPLQLQNLDFTQVLHHRKNVSVLFPGWFSSWIWLYNTSNITYWLFRLTLIYISGRNLHPNS